MIRITCLVRASAALLVALTLAPQAFAAVSPSHPDFSRGNVPTSAGRVAVRKVILGPTDVKNLNTGFTYVTIADAINDAATVNGHVLEVQVTPHNEGIVAVNKSVTIQGMAGGVEVHATTNTGSSGDSRGWFLVTASGVTFKDLTFDGESGSAVVIYQAIRFRADGGLVKDCTFRNIQGGAGSYDGRGVAMFDANCTVDGCSFLNIARIGVHIFGSAITSALVTGCTYTGKGAGDWLDYGVEIGGGATATVTKNTITGNTGVASVDGSTSAGILATDYFAPGTVGTISENFLNGNTEGVAAGYVDGSHPVDATVVTVADNDLSGNASAGVDSDVSGTLDASGNWWGSNVVGAVQAETTGNPIDFTPWLDTGTDTNGGVGFQGDFSTLHVDDDSPQSGTVTRVQEGVNLVTASTVSVGPGTYEEQVVIDKDLLLQGAGASSTTIKSPVTLTAFFTTPGPNNNYPIIFIHDATDVRIENLTVDGDGKGNGNYRFVGIGYWNGGGRVSNVDIVRIRETPFSGTQHGNGIYTNNNTGGPYSLEVARVTVTDFQKNGITMNGAGLSADVHDCTTTGNGYTTVTAQNGIQLSRGAQGSIRACKISDIGYSPATFVASGVIVFETGGPVSVSALNGANAITNVQAPISWYDGNGSMDGIQTVGGADYGPIYVQNSSTSLAPGSARISSGAPRRPRAAALDGDTEAQSGDAARRIQSSLSVTVTNSCLDGTDVAGTAGVGVYTYGGPLSVVARNNAVSDWEVGFTTYGSPAVLTANVNSITSNFTAGYDNTGSSQAQNAENNWWGSALGPSGDGPGTGDAVLGGNVDFTPWLVDGTNLASACGFSAASTTTLASDRNPAFCSEKVNLTATVLPSDATGTVEFFDGANSLGVVVVTGGSATLSVTFASSGSHSLTARYSGDTSYPPSTSNKVDQVIEKRSTTTELTVDRAKSNWGDKVTLTATVSPNTATGTVEFADQGGTPTFFQGFETDNSGWDTQGDPQYDPARVPSGTNGVTSRTGGFHGEAKGPYDLDNDGGGAFTRWGGYSSVFPPGGYTTQIDVYLDVAVAAGAGDKRIDWISAINNSSGIHRRDFVFNMGTEPTGFVIAAGNNSGRGGANPADPGHDPVHITQTGWYTFKHRFYNSGGVLACDLSIIDPNGVVIVGGPAWTRRDPSDLISGIGGNRYGWFAAQELTFLAIDNSVLTRNSLGGAPVVNGVATLSITNLPVGQHALIATYTGDDCHRASVSDKVAQEVNRGPTTTTLSSDPNPSSCGQKVTLTARVAPPAASGEVNFFDGNNAIGSVTLSNGTAILSVPDPTVGIHSFTAVYKGDGCYLGSTSNKVVHLVILIPTTTQLAVDPPKANWGDKVTLTATVAPITATGMVDFYEVTEPKTSLFPDDSIPANPHYNDRQVTVGVKFFADVPGVVNGIRFYKDPRNTGPRTLELWSGTGTLLVSAPSVGESPSGWQNIALPFPVPIQANVVYIAAYNTTTGYPQDQFYFTSQFDSPPLHAPAESAGNPNGVYKYGPPGGFPNQGINASSYYIDVNFAESRLLGSDDLAAGIATLSLTDKAVGAHTLVAFYRGQGCYAAGGSQKTPNAVNRGPTTTTLTSDPNPSECGQKVTFTATVAPAAASGEVNFFDGAAQIGLGTLTNGVATLSITTLAVGPHSVTAVYKGDSCYAGSASNKVAQVVEAATTTTTLTSDPNPSTCGQKVTLTAKLNPTAATGQVNFFDGAVSIGSAALVNGTATLSISTLGAGSHSLTARYKGDACYAASTSNNVNHDVGPASSTTTLTSSPNPSMCDQKVTLTARINPATATGTVNFFDSTAAIGAAPVVNGSAMLSIPTPTHGTHSFTAAYKGDSCAAPSTSDKVVHFHDCPVATLLSLFLAEPKSGAIELRWQFGDPSRFVETRVERGGSGDGPWVQVAADLHDEAGVQVAVDRTVEPGKSYWYRLVARPASGTPLVFGPLAATAGSTIQRFELARIWPNPSKSLTRIDFTVARESNIRLSVLDLQGREMVVLAEGSHRPGRYQAVWTGETARGLAPGGMYFVRYQVPGRVMVGRLVLAH